MAHFNPQLQQVMHDVEMELSFAMDNYPEFASKHEAYGVLSEEFYELLKALHENKPDSNYYLELSQIAAVSIKEMIRLIKYGK